jgi:hypothetical protein
MAPGLRLAWECRQVLQQHLPLPEYRMFQQRVDCYRRWKQRSACHFGGSGAMRAVLE